MKNHFQLLLLLCTALTAPPAAGETIAIFGLSGGAGANGASGDPGADGAPGSDGESVEAVADAPGENNTASARGGQGGRGGNGGNGIPAGANGGNGGAGGNGGDATARAIGSQGALEVEATADAGFPDSGGDPGSAQAPGDAGEPGVVGTGGRAIAEAILDADSPLLATGAARAGEIFFDGSAGNATAVSTVSNASGPAESGASASAGEGDPDATATATASAEAGGSGAATASAAAHGNLLGGDTTAIARATTEDSGPVTVEAIAYMINRTPDLRGAGLAEAYGSNAGPAPVNVRASAINDTLFDSGQLNASPELRATAQGHSSGGGDVNVTANAWGSRYAVPADLSLVDAVSGSTSGHLTLWQEIHGNQRGGDAITSLRAENPGGGDLTVRIGVDPGSLGDAVLGDILATSTAGADVAIAVNAGGGEGGGAVVLENRVAGGPATPARIHGESNGGVVSTNVSLGAPSGYTNPFSPGLDDHPDGFSIDIEDVASGDTSGTLLLFQQASAGASGGLGSGGSARNSLSKETASSSLLLRSIARAGASAADPTATGRSGGAAHAIGNAANSAGTADAIVRAEGGSGGGADGGDAFVEAIVSTTGDGHAVVVGRELRDEFREPSLRVPGDFAVALGGNAQLNCGPPSSRPCPGELPGSGGDATSRSIGRAHGDSPVTVYDFAVGGRGSGDDRLGGTLIDTIGGRGGDATSTAIAEALLGMGSSPVEAESNAYGGAGGRRVTEPGEGGDAGAEAIGTGLGPAQAWARAFGGDSVALLGASDSPTGDAGSATARAKIVGTGGFARSEAITGIGATPQLRAQSEASLDLAIAGVAPVVDAGATFDSGHVVIPICCPSRTTAATATNGAALPPLDLEHDGSAFLTGAPLAADVDTALAGNDAFAVLFESTDSQMLALTRWHGRSHDFDSVQGLALATELEIVMGQGTDSASRLVLGAFDVSVVGDQFERLSFSLEKNGIALGPELHFDGEAALIAYFAETILDLGSGWQAGDHLLARFGLVVGAATQVEMGVGFAMAVPEPGTATLLALGLVVIAWRSRRHASSR